MRIVLDANVIIAAFAARGLCSELFRFALKSCEVVGSKQLLDECEKTLTKKLKIPKEKVTEIISYLKQEFAIIEPSVIDEKACRDVNDLHVLGVALKSKAQFIVTGDEDLLILEIFKETKICTPREFWKLIND